MGWARGIFVFVTATIAMLIFAAATQGWFLVRSRIWESALLLLVAFTMFRPGFFWGYIYPPLEERPGTELVQALENSEPGDGLRLRIAGLNDIGSPVEFVALLPVPQGETGEERLEAAGIELFQDGERTMIDNVAFGSPAQSAGLDWDQEVLAVQAPTDVPSRYWAYIPAFLLLALLIWVADAAPVGHHPA